MQREIIIMDKKGTQLVARNKVAVSCAFDLQKNCKATCAAFEIVGTKQSCMCNRGNFEIGHSV